ncbi:hypothetical protein [Geochorda subterranea]|uniref:Uncharacterized protein n=1 Tax=Geochorda subterranea TaxID=3109564 RepID=A0ABZ1BUP9_9FIRM|nr:hypothetical protein [Limnochorda sp. LNt]WRP15847.1 hypothetical protein VLY81_06760 [Limnochorda sp. LNt]
MKSHRWQAELAGLAVVFGVLYAGLALFWGQAGQAGAWIAAALWRHLGLASALALLATLGVGWRLVRGPELAGTVLRLGGPWRRSPASRRGWSWRRASAGGPAPTGRPARLPRQPRRRGGPVAGAVAGAGGRPERRLSGRRADAPGRGRARLRGVARSPAGGARARRRVRVRLALALAWRAGRWLGRAGWQAAVGCCRGAGGGTGCGGRPDAEGAPRRCCRCRDPGPPPGWARRREMALAEVAVDRPGAGGAPAPAWLPWRPTARGDGDAPGAVPARAAGRGARHAGGPGAPGGPRRRPPCR